MQHNQPPLSRKTSHKIGGDKFTSQRRTSSSLRLDGHIAMRMRISLFTLFNFLLSYFLIFLLSFAILVFYSRKSRTGVLVFYSLGCVCVHFVVYALLSFLFISCALFVSYPPSSIRGWPPLHLHLILDYIIYLHTHFYTNKFELRSISTPSSSLRSIFQ